MKNYENCKYTYIHRKMVMFLVNYYITDEDIKLEMIERAKNHDLDKMLLYISIDKRLASGIHKDTASHHLNNSIVKNKYDFIEAALDWESCRYSKADKPLDAYNTLYKYYPKFEKEMLEVFKFLNIKNMCNKKDPIVEGYFNSIRGNVNQKDIENEIKNYVASLCK